MSPPPAPSTMIRRFAELGGILGAPVGFGLVTWALVFQMGNEAAAMAGDWQAAAIQNLAVAVAWAGGGLVAMTGLAVYVVGIFLSQKL